MTATTSDYVAYRLRWRSSITLPFAASPGPAGEPDVTVRPGETPARLPGAARGTPHVFEAAPGAALLHVAGVACYFVTPREIVVEPRGGSDEDVVTFLVGPALAALLQMRGVLTLHAAAVEMDAGAVLLLGGSGAGKSALAAALVERGHALLADDVTGLAPAAGDVLALPAFPRLRLWADVLPAADRRRRVRPNLEQYWKPAARFAAAPRPVCAAFVLESHDRADFDVEPMPSSQAFRGMRRYTYRKRLLDVLGQRPTQYRIGMAFARGVPLARVRRPDHPFRLVELADRVEAHVRGAFPPRAGSPLPRSPAEGSAPGACTDLPGDANPAAPKTAGLPSASPAASLRPTVLSGRAPERRPAERRAPSRPGIVWIASYPKSGSTWMRAMLTNYLQDNGEPASINALAGLRTASARDNFDELIGLDSSDLRPDELARYLPRFRALLAQALSAPRPDDCAIDRIRPHAPHFAKVHEAYRDPLGGARFSRIGTVGVIYLVRNPLDVAVSYAHHLQWPIDRILRMMNNPAASETSSTSWIGPLLPSPLTTWSGHVSGWLDQTDLRTHAVRYEDLLADPRAGFGAIVRFAGLEWDAARLDRAIEHAAFPRLRAQEAESGFHERQPTAPSFFRAGVAGSWRTALTREQVRALVDDHGPVMARHGYLREAEAFLAGEGGGGP